MRRLAPLCGAMLPGCALVNFVATTSLGLGVCFTSVVASAKPVVQQHERLEVNWGTLRIRFYGEAKLSNDNSDFKAVEKAAWRDGLRYVTDAVRNLHISVNENRVRDPERLSNDAKNAAQTVSTSTFSYNTTYFGDGTVRVHLENTLAKALATSKVRFHQKEALDPGLIQFTGIVFKTNKPMDPVSIYEVVDRRGEVLFNVTDMAKDAFEKNLMGRWFEKPKPAELVTAVGKKPIIINTSSDGGGRFVVDRREWDRGITGHRSLLRSGRIAIALP